MKILGLDLSLTAPGVAVFDPAFTLSTCTRAFTIRGIPEGRMERIAYIRNRVWDFAHDCGLVVIEGPSFASRLNLGFQLGELGGVVRLMLHERGIRWMEVAPTSLKKFVTGKGNAEKDLMMLKVFQRFGVDCENNNESDAVSLAHVGAAREGLWTPTTAEQVQVLAQIQAGKAKKPSPRKERGLLVEAK